MDGKKSDNAGVRRTRLGLSFDMQGGLFLWRAAMYV